MTIRVPFAQGVSLMFRFAHHVTFAALIALAAGCNPHHGLGELNHGEMVERGLDASDCRAARRLALRLTFAA